MKRIGWQFSRASCPWSLWFCENLYLYIYIYNIYIMYAIILLLHDSVAFIVYVCIYVYVINWLRFAHVGQKHHDQKKEWYFYSIWRDGWVGLLGKQSNLTRAGKHIFIFPHYSDTSTFYLILEHLKACALQEDENLKPYILASCTYLICSSLSSQQLLSNCRLSLSIYLPDT